MSPVGEVILCDCCNAIFNRFVVAAAALMAVGDLLFTNHNRFYIAGAVDFLKLDYCQHRRGPGKKEHKAAFTCRH